MFTYLPPLIDFKRYFPNRTQKNKKSSLEFNSFLFPRNENFSILEIFTLSCQGVIQVLFDDVIRHFHQPIHVNFPITSKCVLKATVHRKKNSELFYPTGEFFFFKKKLLWYCTSMLYLINVSIISRSVRIFHVSLSMIYQLFSPHHVLHTRFFLNIHKGFFL